MSPVRGLRAASRRRGAAGGPPGWARNRSRAKRCPRSPSCPNGARSPATSVPWRYGNLRLPTTASDARRPSPRRISSCCLLMRGAAVRRRRLPHVLGQLQDARSATSALDRRYSEPRLADVIRLEAYPVDVFVDAERGGWKARRVREPLLSDRHQRAYDTSLGGRLLPVWRATRRRDSCFGTTPPPVSYTHLTLPTKRIV